MITCKEIRDKFSEYIDHELNEEDTQLVEQHISQCEACNKEMKKYLKIERGMDILRKAEPPADSLEKLHKRIAQREMENIF